MAQTRKARKSKGGATMNDRVAMAFLGKKRLPRRAEAARVLLRRPSNIDAFGSRTGVNQSGDLDAFAAEFRCATRYGPLRLWPVVRLIEEGIDWGAEPQPGDEIGYGMDPHRTDTCLQAAIATATQVPIEQVPDLRLDKRLAAGEDPNEISRTTWQRIATWVAGRGLALTFHEQVPAERPRWIGVVASPYGDARYAFDGEGGAVREEGTKFNDHCLVMSHDRLVFDPSCSVKVPPGALSVAFSPDGISYGISFDPVKEH